MKLVIKSVILSILLTLSIYAQPVNQYVIKRNGTAVIDTLYTTKHITDTAVVSDIQINGSLRANDFQIKNRLTEAVKFSIDTNGTVSGNNLIILGNATLGGSMATINDNPGGSMYGYSLNGKNLSGANYNGAKFYDESDPPQSMSLSDVDMSFALCIGADFTGVTFDDLCVLDNINATSADFDSVNFNGCSFLNVIAINAIFTNAILPRDIGGSDFRGANLTGATVPFTLEEFKAMVVWDITTKWTDGNFLTGTQLDIDNITVDTLTAYASINSVDISASDDITVGDDLTVTDLVTAGRLNVTGAATVGTTLNVTDVVASGVVQADTIVGTVVGDMQWNGIPAAYQFDGVDDFVTVPDNDNLDFGTGDFSIEMFVNVAVLSTNYLISKISGTSGFIIQTESNGIIYPRLRPNGGVLTNYATNPITITTNRWNHILMTFDRDGNYVGYLNGAKINEIAISASAGDLSNSTSLSIFTTGAVWLNGQIGFIRLYNRVLSQSEITARWNNGAPHLYRLEFADRNASQTPLYTSNFTAGVDSWTGTNVSVVDADSIAGEDNALLVTLSGGSAVHSANRLPSMSIGKKYRISFRYYIRTDNAAVDSISLYADTRTTLLVPASALNVVGAWTSHTVEHTVKSDGIYFYAGNGGVINADADKFYLKDVVVTPIGCTAEYTAENAGAMGWIETMNRLHGSTSGTPIAPQAERDYRSLISTTPVELTRSQKAQTILTRIVAINNDSSNARTISIGTTTGGTELVNAQSIGAGATIVISVGAYSATERSIYAVASGASVTIKLIYEKVAQ